MIFLRGWIFTNLSWAQYKTLIWNFTKYKLKRTLKILRNGKDLKKPNQSLKKTKKKKIGGLFISKQSR